MAFEEKILGTNERTHLAESYDRLTSLIIRANRGDVITLLEEAGKLAEDGNVEMADMKYQEAIEVDPKGIRALLEYARFLRIRGKLEAITFLERARDLSPNDPKVIAQLIRTHLNMGQPARANHYLDEFLAHSSDAEELEAAGDLFGRKGIIESAPWRFMRTCSTM